MPVRTETSFNKRVLTIFVEGRFDYQVHRQFKEAYLSAKEPGSRFIIDLSRTEYLDSSALGMILMLREHVGGDAARIRLAHVNETVRQVLKIARFEELFDIS